ncbi:hypothetical protein [Pedobacter sp. Leaf132]|uniref:hypothetical protein n=1 Tax=Pedobacter sp. Leaf132 TaxID=2876557 RepID=UPI001E505DCC|nr:hypothetical protein [Pedobacter sp. Leaf132]
MVIGQVDSNAQGCAIDNYNNFNRVFNAPTGAGARTFLPGNGRNFVRWEGVCGPHTYVSITSTANGTCSVTESGVTRNGIYYPTVSSPFTSACPVPLDDYIIYLIIVVGTISYFHLRRFHGKRLKI